MVCVDLQAPCSPPPMRSARVPCIDIHMIPVDASIVTPGVSLVSPLHHTPSHSYNNAPRTLKQWSPSETNRARLPCLGGQ